MKITVAMVCFNSAKAIRASLESVAAQTYPDLELIVVDGGSTDATMSIVADYRHLQGSAISEPDGGIYDAMNKALARAGGEVIFYLNSDDRFYDRTVVADFMAVLREGAVDIVYGDVMCITDGAGTLRRQGSIGRGNILFEGLCHQSIFSRTRVLRDGGGFDTRYRICADFDWITRALRSGVRARHLPRVVADYSMSGFSERQLALRAQERRAIQLKHVAAPLLPVLSLGYRALRRARRVMSAPSLDEGLAPPAIRSTESR